MIQRRHPAVAVQILQELSQPHVASFHIATATAAQEGLGWLEICPPSHAKPWVAMGGNRSRALSPRGETSPTTSERRNRHCCVLNAAHDSALFRVREMLGRRGQLPEIASFFFCTLE